MTLRARWVWVVFVFSKAAVPMNSKPSLIIITIKKKLYTVFIILFVLRTFCLVVLEKTPKVDQMVPQNHHNHNVTFCFGIEGRRQTIRA